MSAHELDHLAIAVRSWSPAGEQLNRELGARWASGFSMPVFSPCQLALAEDMRIELLEPGSDEHSFIRRFLDENDSHAAPHHITFKVHDIRAAIAGAQDVGIEPILVNLEHPEWQEAFLHPKDTGLGFLAQMVQAPHSVEELTSTDGQWNTPCPWNPEDLEPVHLPVIHGTVVNLEKARRVLVEVLGAVEFTIPGPGAGFRWDAGADLVLGEVPSGSKPPGIRGIGVLPPGSRPRDYVYTPRLFDVLESGIWHPDLGLRISSLPVLPIANAG